MWGGPKKTMKRTRQGAGGGSRATPSVVDDGLLEAAAKAALHNLDKNELRETLVSLIAQKAIAELRPADLAQTIVDERGAEIGNLIVHAILRGD